MRRPSVVTASCCAALQIACSIDITAGDSPSEIDEGILAALAEYQSFAKINNAPFASQIAANDVNVFASAPGYASIHPDSTSTAVVFPTGTLLVRQVLGSDGSVAELTLMAKGPLSADPEVGDWLYGITDPDGVPLVGSAGSAELGQMPECHSCHVARAACGYVFGVAEADQ